MIKKFFVVLFAFIFLAQPAFADELSDANQKVEEASAEYAEAQEKIDSLQKKIEDTEEKISELEEQKAEDAEVAAKFIRHTYKMYSNRNLVLEFLLGASSMEELVSEARYTEAVMNKTEQSSKELIESAEALKSAKRELQDAKEDAISEKAKARDLLSIAEAAREKAIAAKAEQEAKEKEEREKEEASGNLSTESSEDNGGTVTTTTTQSAPQSSIVNGAINDLSEIQSKQTKEEFVAEWQPRIDRFLAGYPLSGYGRVFAEAAYDYGVDPRWSPAISNTESTRGKYCFLPHNAWGWGHVSWPDWETAIRAHIRGLARGYGYTISPAAAQKYCPIPWEDWYNVTLSAMSVI